jgi:putative ABC transport system ATP-binding protein
MKLMWRPNRGNGSGGAGRADGLQDTAPSANGALIHFDRVSKIYNTSAGSFTALKDVDLNIRRGELVSIVGKSGSGKTTLVNMLTGIDLPSSGGVFVDGTPVHELNEGARAVWRGKHIGIVFQFFQLLPALTIKENIRLPMDFGETMSPAEREARALELLETVQLADQANALPSHLSGGQQQQAAIARALANDPPIIATDEPTGNLDSASAESIIGLFESLVSSGKTILMVTHDDDIAHHARRIIRLADGEIVG